MNNEKQAQDILRGNAVVGQSGGPTAAINATLAGVIRGVTDLRRGRGECPIRHLYGMKNGVDGLLRGELIDLDLLFDPAVVGSEKNLDTLTLTPSSALGSCRRRLPAPGAPDEDAVMGQLLRILREHDIRYFFYIGGNDSMDTVAKLSAYAEAHGYEMRVIGVPKTIDNDLEGTDHTDLVYLPERPFRFEEFYEDVADALQKHPNVVVAVSEGLKLPDGRYVGESAQSGSVDAFGHKYLAGTGKALELAVREKFGCKVRSVELNLPQRCAAHLASAQDIEESLAVGAAAVRAAVAGISRVMMTIRRTSDQPYAYAIDHADIFAVANRTRAVPDAYINRRGNRVTDACLDYLLPLIRGERYPIYENGLPRHMIL